MTAYLRLRSVGRPKTGAGHVGQDRVIGGWDLRKRVDGLRAVSGPE